MQTLPRHWRAIKQFRRSLIFCSGVLLAGIIAAGVWIGHSQLFASATSLQPQQFTELYFTHPEALPQHVVYGQTYTVQFTIANHSRTAQTYTYQTIVQTAAAIQGQDPVTVQVPAGGLITRQAVIATPVPQNTTLVHIGLAGGNQQIQFYAKP